MHHDGRSVRQNNAGGQTLSEGVVCPNSGGGDEGSVRPESKSTEVVVKAVCDPTVEVVVTSGQGPTPSVVRTLPDPLGGQKSPLSIS